MHDLAVWHLCKLHSDLESQRIGHKPTNRDQFLNHALHPNHPLRPEHFLPRAARPRLPPRQRSPIPTAYKRRSSSPPPPLPSKLQASRQTFSHSCTIYRILPRLAQGSRKAKRRLRCVVGLCLVSTKGVMNVREGRDCLDMPTRETNFCYRRGLCCCSLAQTEIGMLWFDI